MTANNEPIANQSDSNMLKSFSEALNNTGLFTLRTDLQTGNGTTNEEFSQPQENV